MLCQAEQKTDNKDWKLREASALTIEVITGLSQGEQLKLDDSPILIGGSEDCDIYLSEPSLSQASLTAELSANKVCISPIHNSGCDAYFGVGKFKKTITDSTYFSAGDSFCLGGVWLKISSSKTRSQKKVISGNTTPTDTTTENTIEPANEFKPHTKPKETEKDSALIFGLGADDFLSTRTSRKAFELDTDNDSHFLRMAGLKAGSLFLSSIGICALTISVAQGVNKPSDISYSSTNDSTHNYSTASYASASEQKSSYGESLLADIRANIEHESNLDIMANKQASHSHDTKTIDEKEKLPYLKSIFSQMLMARELPQTVSLSYDNHSWVISGHLDKEKQNILNRMISRFKSEQNIKAPINNEVKSAFSSLPFEIVQVTSGRYGNIVTQSGDRLFVGDQLEGYQLVAIQDHQLVFTGKSRVTVAW